MFKKVTYFPIWTTSFPVKALHISIYYIELYTESITAAWSLKKRVWVLWSALSLDFDLLLSSNLK